MGCFAEFGIRGQTLLCPKPPNCTRCLTLQLRLLLPFFNRTKSFLIAAVIIKQPHAAGGTQTLDSSTHLLKHLPHCSATRLLLWLHPAPRNDPLVRVSTAAHQQNLLQKDTLSFLGFHDNNVVCATRVTNLMIIYYYASVS